MTANRKHSATGEAFRQMDDAKLRRVLQRRYRRQADRHQDRYGAQTELRRRREAS